MAALKPSINLSGKSNVIPSIDRKTEATAEDFKEISDVLTDHANLIDGINRTDEQSKFYGFFTHIDLLRAAYPVAEENGFAVIDPLNGNPQSIAKYNAGVWTAEEVKAPIKFYATKADRPSPGEQGVWYIVKDEKIAYLWYDAQYNGFGNDGSNGLSAYEIAVAVTQFEGTELEWLESLKGKSAYQSALDSGFVGTEAEWIASLEGPEGKDNYQLWLDAGNVGTFEEYLETLRGPQGIQGPAGIDKWKGSFLTKAALVADFPEGAGQAWHNNEGGWTADVDAGANAKVVRYIWDASDLTWEIQVGESTAETAASIKTKYESNADTNAFTDALLAKLNSITEIFTTALKASYDTAASWVSTNGASVLSRLTALESGKNPIAVNSSRNLTAADNGANLCCGTAGITLTYPAGGLGASFRVNFSTNATGTITLANANGTTDGNTFLPESSMGHVFIWPAGSLTTKGDWE